MFSFFKTPMVCTLCGHYGKPVKNTPGSGLVELFLWILFIIPGVLYSCWRISARKDVCKKCASPELVPADTPRGKKILETTEQ